MHRRPGFGAAAGGGDAAGGFEQEGHVVGEGPHGLHAFCVQGSLAGFAAVDDVPVLGGDDGHVHHLEGEVEGFETGRRAAPAADGDGRCRLTCDRVSVGEEGALDDGQQGAVGLAVVDGGADYQRVGVGEALADAVADVVVEDAAACARCLASAAGDAAADGFVADPEGFGVDAILLQLSRDFAERGGGVALLSGASVDEEYFHGTKIRFYFVSSVSL